MVGKKEDILAKIFTVGSIRTEFKETYHDLAIMENLD